MRKPHIVVVGSSNTDLTIVSRELPRPGATVRGERVFEAGGGKGANQAVCAARCGAEVTFVGRIGDDYFGRRRLSELRREGIRTELVVLDPEAHSGMALIMVGASGENMISVALGSNELLCPDDVRAAADAVRDADVLLVQFEVGLDSVATALEMAREAGTVTVLDPAPVPEDPIPEGLLRNVDFMTPNLWEAVCLLGREEAEEPSEIASALGEMGPGAVVLTLGAEGVCVWSEAGSLVRPAVAANPVDTVGAGDCFAGALAVGVAEGKSLSEAIDFASAAAAVAVERAGAQPSLPVRCKVIERMSREGPGATDA